MLRVIIADDHPVVRRGLRRALAEAPDVSIVGEAASYDELLGHLPAQPCDVLLLDMALGGDSGLEVVRQLKQTYPRLPIVLFTLHDERRYVEQALAAGALGYVTKGQPIRELLAALRAGAAGKRYLSPGWEDLSIPAPIPRALSFSPREQQVLRMLGEGYDFREMVNALGISAKTVSTYRDRLKEKLRVSSTRELTYQAVRYYRKDAAQQMDVKSAR